MAGIRVLIVDDSAFMRKSLSVLLEADSEIKVVGTAKDGIEAIEQTKKLQPDVITLDIEMPRMDGLTALQRIISECATPVIMVSSITTEGAEATLQALELGAVDFIPKDLSISDLNIGTVSSNLIDKVKAVTKKKLLSLTLAQEFEIDKKKDEVSQSLNKFKPLPRIGYKAIAIGISTGGPLSLKKILPEISPNLNVPIFIVQHMPPQFTKSLSERLNSVCSLEVKEAENNEQVRKGVVYLAPGGQQMRTVKNGNSEVVIEIIDSYGDLLYKPSVDVMLDSVINIYGKYTLGMIMTGMGKDGYVGIGKLKSLGGFCIAQDETSSVVYGMPKAIIDAGFADVIASLDKIPEIINQAI